MVVSSSIVILHNKSSDASLPPFPVEDDATGIALVWSKMRSENAIGDRDIFQCKRGLYKRPFLQQYG
eukprot:scaffold285882_cov30-Tisochrysis_lutea.AAC.2